MGLRSADATLQQLYTVRDDLLTGKVQSYQMGDRNITLFNLTELEAIIRNYENIVMASQPIVADLSGVPNFTPFPNG